MNTETLRLIREVDRYITKRINNQKKARIKPADRFAIRDLAKITITGNVILKHSENPIQSYPAIWVSNLATFRDALNEAKQFVKNERKTGRLKAIRQLGVGQTLKIETAESTEPKTPLHMSQAAPTNAPASDPEDPNDSQGSGEYESDAVSGEEGEPSSPTPLAVMPEDQATPAQQGKRPANRPAASGQDTAQASGPAEGPNTNPAEDSEPQSDGSAGSPPGQDMQTKMNLQLYKFLKRSNEEAKRRSRSRSTTPSAVTSESKLTDAGIFWPDPPKDIKEDTSGVFVYDKLQSYTDVHKWRNRVEEWVGYDTGKELAVRNGAYKLLRGKALNWWDQALSKQERTEYSISHTTLLDAITKEFGIKLAKAQKWIVENPYTAKDVRANKPVREYAYEVFKYARSIGDTTELQLLTRLHEMWLPSLRKLLEEPSSTTKVSEYLNSIEKKQAILREELTHASAATTGNFAEENDEDDDPSTEANWSYPNDTRYRGGNDRARPFFRSNQRNIRSPGQQDRPFRPWNDFGSFRRDNFRPRGGSYSPRPQPRGPPNQPFRRDTQPFRGDSRRWGRYRQFGRPQGRADGTWSYINETTVYQHEDPNDERSTQLVQEGYVCYSDGETELDNDQGEDTFICVEEENVESSFFVYPTEATEPGDSPNPPIDFTNNLTRTEYGTEETSMVATTEKEAAPKQVRFAYPVDTNQPIYACTACQLPFDSEKTLLAHGRNSCIRKDSGLPKRVTAVHFASTRSTSNPADLDLQDEQVVEANPIPRAGGRIRQKTSYLKVNVKADVDGVANPVCLDTGSSSILVDREWVTNWAKNPRFFQVDPIPLKGVKSKSSIDTQVEFDFYIRGLVGDKYINGHFPVRANVIDELGPKMLIGTDFMRDHGVRIDFNTSTCNIGSVFDLEIEGEIVPQQKTHPATRRVTAVDRTTIPAMGEAYIYVEYADLPKPIDKKDRSAQPYHFHASRDGVLDATVDRFSPKRFVVRNKNAWPLTINKGERLGQIREYIGDEKAMLANWSDICTHWEDDTSPEVWSNIVEELNDRAKEEVSALFSSNYTAATSTEKAESEDRIPTDLEKPLKPEYYTPSYGITKPIDVPAIKSKAGVSVGNVDSDIALKFKDLVDKYDIFRDRGIIPMPEDQKMKVDFVDGWQSQLKPVRSYPLGMKDREFLDQAHNKLHAQGKMSFETGPTSVACPTFVVWRETEGKTKGRPVVDLRPLNRVVVPDIYPLPDQDDVMSDMAGMKFFTSVDASAFFFQLPVRMDHRNRMVIISHRGLESSNVALMGFRNSPAFGQRFMDRLFFPHREFVRAYIDDIIIFSKTAEEHLQHVATVFDLLDKNRVHISPLKSFVAYPSVRLLGYNVDGKGVSKTDDRINAFKRLEFPRTLDQLETYLGMAGWLRKGIAWFEVKAEPLQQRKTALLAEMRDKGTLPIKMSKQMRQLQTSKVTFEPTAEELEAFKQLQQHLCTQYVTHHHDTDRPLFFKVDACPKAWGLMVFQLRNEWDGSSIPGREIPTTEVLPLLFMSKITSSGEKKYGSTEAEVAAVIWACRKLRKLIQSNKKPVTIFTDHAATKGIVTHTSMNTLDLNKANPRLANAANYLSQFELQIFHIPGPLNVVPDALSRLPTSIELEKAAFTDSANELDDIWEDSNVWYYVTDEEPDKATATAVIGDEFRAKIIKGYAEDHKYGTVYKILKKQEDRNRPAPSSAKDGETNNSPEDDDGKPVARFPFTLQEGLLYHVDLDGNKGLCIPRSCVQPILELVHDNKHHFGKNRMMDDLQGIHFFRKYWHVRKFVQHCKVCRENQQDRNPTPGSLMPIRTPPIPYHTITLDLITDMPEVKSKDTFWSISGWEILNCLMTVSCKFSKKTLLIPGSVTYTAKEWAIVLLRALEYADWGLPSQIISDRDRKFVSDLWKALFTLLKVSQLFSTAYHPQTDGLSERKNHTVEIAIRFHTASDPDTPWTNMLTALQHHLNNSLAITVGKSPNELVTGLRPRSILDILNANKGREVASEIDDIVRADDARQAAHLIDIAAVIAKERYDDKHTPMDLKKNEVVYLRLHKGYHLPGKPKAKWSPPRAGPFKVVRKISPSAYELDFPSTWGVHPVVSIAHLWKPEQGSDPFSRKTPEPEPVATDETGGEWELERIVERKIRWYRKNPRIHYLVRWKGYTAKDDDWRPREDLLQTAKDLVTAFEDEKPIDWPAEYRKKGFTYRKSRKPARR